MWAVAVAARDQLEAEAYLLSDEDPGDYLRDLMDHLTSAPGSFSLVVLNPMSLCVHGQISCAWPH